MKKRFRKRFREKGIYNIVMTFIKITFLFFAVNFVSCDYVKYVKAIKDEAKRDLIANKKFMREVSFDAYVIEKYIYKDNANNCKYSLSIHLLFISKKPGVCIHSAPYFDLENDTIMRLSVSKIIFNKIKLNDKIIKQGNSLHLVINNQKYQYLSKEEGKWLD